MKRVFADLHLCLNPKETATTSRAVMRSASLGYGLISVPLSVDTDSEKKHTLTEVCSKAGIDFASRVDLRPRTADQLKTQLRELRRRYDVVCVSCVGKEIARQAAKDRRVDLVNFPLVDYKKRFLDRAEAELISSGLAAWEIDMKFLFLLEGVPRIRLLSTIRRELSIARDFKVPIVLSSGTDNELLLRKPREIAAVAELFEIDESSALDAISTTPIAIVKRNREKLDPKFVAPGINVMREGRDC